MEKATLIIALVILSSALVIHGVNLHKSSREPRHHHQQHSKKTHYFYVYDYGYWSNISSMSMNLRDDPNEILEMTLNNGAGSLVNASRGAYHTDQYQLFLLIYHRAMKDYRRTLDPSMATTFLIPYDMASDVAYYKRCVKSEGTCFDFRKCPLAPTVESLLRQSKWYRRKEGRDHVLIVGNNYAMEHYLNKPRCKAFLSGVCYNCTKFAIDDYSFLHSADQGTVTKGDYWHAAPFPADFHFTKQVIPPFPWENTQRPILVSYIGTTKSYYAPARKLRGSLAHYCEKHPDVCVHQSYGLNGTRSSFLVEGYDPLEVSLKSVFCFQPIGDLMTRKGLFDSILQGCIPVVFDVLTASAMYTWHWEESFWDEVVVSFAFHPVANRYLDPVEELKKLYESNRDLVTHKQALIRSRVFQLQYGLDGMHDVDVSAGAHFHPFNGADVEPESAAGDGDGNHHPIDNMEKNKQQHALHQLEKRLKLFHPVHWPREKDGQLQRDAFDIIIDHALGWHSGTEPDVRNGTVPECWNGWLNKALNKCVPGTDPSEKK